jgi:hypothetical protein
VTRERKFLEGCWTDQGGLHLRIEEDEYGRVHIIVERGPGGDQVWGVSIASFRRERIGKAILGKPEPEETT